MKAACTGAPGGQHTPNCPARASYLRIEGDAVVCRRVPLLVAVAQRRPLPRGGVHTHPCRFAAQG